MPDERTEGDAGGGEASFDVHNFLCHSTGGAECIREALFRMFLIMNTNRVCVHTIRCMSVLGTGFAASPLPLCALLELKLKHSPNLTELRNYSMRVKRSSCKGRGSEESSSKRVCTHQFSLSSFFAWALTWTRMSMLSRMLASLRDLRGHGTQQNPVLRQVTAP